MFDIDKKMLYEYHRQFLLNKISNLFIYDNMPSTVDINYLNKVINIDGSVLFFNYNNELVCNKYQPTGKFDIYYKHIEYIVTNPYFSEDKTLILNNKNSVIVYNTYNDINNINGHKSLNVINYLIDTTAKLLTENYISIICQQINTRLALIAEVKDKNESDSIKEIYKNILNGCTIQSIINRDIDIDANINVHTFTDNTKVAISELINLQQYVLSTFYNNFGINNLITEKKERLISDEVNINQQIQELSIDNMLKCRQDCFDKVNEMFNTNINVKLNPILIRKEDGNE